MVKRETLQIAMAFVVCAACSPAALHAADVDGKWSVGLRGGLYKPVLTDHSDAWTPGWLANADVKYGLTSKFSLGVEGSWMQTYLADLSGDNKLQDGAGFSFDKISDGPKQRGYIAGLVGEYQFAKDSRWSPYVALGTGMYIWKWTDKDGNTLMSDDPALDDPRAGTALVPDEDLAGNAYELKDQELYVMGGTGVDYGVSDLVSVGLGVKFRYLTHVFTSFTDDKDIVGSDPGQLDLPRGLAEGFLALTFRFGAGCPEASASATSDPSSGPVPLDVQFNASVLGGCPGYTYAWDFGDGTTSTEQNPRHTYDKEGNYTASLTVRDSKDHAALSSMTVTASCPPLDATAVANPATGDAPLNVSFEANASGGCPPLTYAWDFGDGATSAEQNPKHMYEKEGTVTPTLTVTDSKGVTVKKQTPPVVAAAAFIPTPDNPVVLEGVHFQTNKATLLPESSQILDRVAESLIAHPDVKVEVGGHTDSDGSESYNLKLSQKRANTVRDYLVKKGVPASQLTARGYGEVQPVADNVTPEGKATNRRVELKAM
ncbi:MAG TPA: PKD domain-containing protein [Gemmatimonadaceae bacterium]